MKLPPVLFGNRQGINYKKWIQPEAAGSRERREQQSLEAGMEEKFLSDAPG